MQLLRLSPTTGAESLKALHTTRFLALSYFSGVSLPPPSCIWLKKRSIASKEYLENIPCNPFIFFYFGIHDWFPCSKSKQHVGRRAGKQEQMGMFRLPVSSATSGTADASRSSFSFRLVTSQVARSFNSQGVLCRREANCHLKEDEATPQNQRPVGHVIPL